MKKQNVEHWIVNEYIDGMLLFAQALEEETFNYSYESYRVPALNSHYLCYDIIMTANDINRKVLMDGNFVPLSEEFEQAIHEDVFIQENIANDGILLFLQDKSSRYYNLEDCELKAKIKQYPEIATFIKNISELNNNYLSFLLSKIIENIFVDSYGYRNSQMIYSLTRMLASELINGGYSKEYIYFTVQEMFFNPSNPVKCSPNTIIHFFNHFTFEPYEYEVAFGIKKKASKFLEGIENITIQKPTLEQRKKLNLQNGNGYVALIPIESIDAYSAYETAILQMQTILSFHRIKQHNSIILVSPKAIVSKKVPNSFDKETTIGFPVNAMKKKGNTSDLHAIFSDVTLINKLELPISFYKSIGLHNGAIESKDITNQLLNLWTIIEILIDSKRDNEDKINTICTVLSSILNRSYIYENIEQLLCDIEKCSEIDALSLISQVESNIKELDMVERLILLLSLSEYSDALSLIVNSLNRYPLLVYRIRFFSTEVFRNSKTVFDYLQRHKKRIRWHIMRIYRNRNMIVHNGSYMPYLKIIIENLHFYVDALLDTLIEFYHLNLFDHSTIYKYISSRELKHQLALGFSIKSHKSKEINKEIKIDKQNALELILNGYRGNFIEKVFDMAVTEQINEDENKNL